MRVCEVTNVPLGVLAQWGICDAYGQLDGIALSRDAPCRAENGL